MATEAVDISADDFRFNPPSFPDGELADILEGEFGVSGARSPLEGERDQNTHVVCGDGREYVLKIASPGESARSVDFQIRALEHLRTVDPGLAVPRHVRTRGGSFSAVVEDRAGRPHLARLLTFVPGRIMLGLPAPALHTIRQIGGISARLCRALRGFDHPAAAHFMAWDLMNGLLARAEFVERYLPADVAASVAATLRRLADHGLPAMAQFPAQVVHSDLHAGNLLVAPDRPDQVCGVIDFGDMVKRPLVVELAGSVCSLIEREADVVTVSKAYIEGFQRHLSVPEQQVGALYDALCARQILTVLLFHFRLREVGHDGQIAGTYLPRSLAGLRHLQATDRGAFTDTLLRALR